MEVGHVRCRSSIWPTGYQRQNRRPIFITEEHRASYNLPLHRESIQNVIKLYRQLGVQNSYSVVPSRWPIFCMQQSSLISSEGEHPTIKLTNLVGKKGESQGVTGGHPGRDVSSHSVMGFWRKPSNGSLMLTKVSKSGTYQRKEEDRGQHSILMNIMGPRVNCRLARSNDTGKLQTLEQGTNETGSSNKHPPR